MSIRRTARRLGVGDRTAAVGLRCRLRSAASATGSATGAAIGSTSQNVRRQVGIVEEARRPARSRRRGAPRGVDRSSTDAGRAVARAPRATAAEPGRGHAALVERRGMAAVRVVAGRRGRRSCRRRSSRRPGPRTTTVPPVMYSQPCGPMPSTTASAPLLRTAKRIPARPTRWSRPPVAPYRHGVAGDRLGWRPSAARSGSGATVIEPPDRPLPT